ncbi:MAG: pilus assembly protein PilM [Planctomycetes bacterium]|nr:pilus assembly protein PilM [Planctomycetota bacterium]
MKIAYGVDVGADSIKVARVARGARGVRVERVARVPLAALRARGVDVEDENDVAAALRNELDGAGLRLRGAALAVGREAILRYSRVPPVPPWRLALIMRYEIEDVVEKRGEDVAADYRLVLVPRSHTDELTVMVGMADATPLAWRLSALANAGVGIAAVNPAPLAFFNALRLTGELPDPGTAVGIDLGHASTQIVVARDGELVFARSASLGVSDFLGRVQERLGVDEAAAGRLVRERGDANRAGDPVSEAMGEVAGNLYAAVSSTLQFARAQTRLPETDLRPERVLLAGGGSALRGLAAYLGASLEAPVSVSDPTGGVAAGGDDPVPPPAYAVAVGLGAALLDPLAASLDLLPARYKERRRFRTRTRFLVAAGVLAFLGVALSFVGATAEWSRKRERTQALTSRREELTARLRDHREAEEARERARSVARELARTAAPAVALARLADLLRSAPRSVAVSSLELPGEGRPRGDGALTATVRGEVDNASDDGLDVVDRLATALAGAEGIAEARPDGGSTVEDRAAGVVRFRLDVVFAPPPGVD